MVEYLQTDRQQDKVSLFVLYSSQFGSRELLTTV